MGSARSLDSSAKSVERPFRKGDGHDVDLALAMFLLAGASHVPGQLGDGLSVFRAVGRGGASSRFRAVGANLELDTS